MEKSHTLGKENLFEAINCSPILSSGRILEESQTERLIYSPLSERNLASQGNCRISPGAHKTSKVGLFLSTPVQEDPISDSWEEIRQLDEDELWIERTQVVTTDDHLLYSEFAKEVVNNIIENLPVFNMDESSTGCDNTVVAVDVMKDDLVNGCDNAGYTGETVCNGSDIVCDERIEDVARDLKDIPQNNENVHLSDELVEKGNTEEDNDFIHSCSELDMTVKEVTLNDDSGLESTISEEKSFEDLDETIKEVLPEGQASSTNATSLSSSGQQDLDPELADDFNFQFDEDAFKPAAAFDLELDFLEKCGNTNSADYESDLARQSLYVKFDPLVEARKPAQKTQDTESFPNINPADLIFSGPLSSDNLLGMDTPPAKPVVSRRALAEQTQNTETVESTPVSTVAPVDLFDLPQDIGTTENAKETESSISESNIVATEDEPSLVQPLQFSQKDLDKAVEEAKEKVLSQWKVQNSLHEDEMEKLLEERNKVMDENKVVKTLMMEYEQSMAQMIKERENEQTQQEKSNSEVVRERDQLQRDLNNTEKSFAHLHEKFGKLKTAVESYRKNEDVLKKVVKDLQEDVKNSEAKYQVLKGRAEQKLQEANAEINRVQNAAKTELAGLQAALKREKTKNSSLQQSLDQKVSENKELTAICDELISKVGPMP